MFRSAAPVWTKLHGAVHRRLIFFAGGRFSRFCRPVFIAFLLTERCNARCVHCDIWKNKGKEESPGIDEWKKVLEDLRRWLGPVGMVFTGGEVFRSGCCFNRGKGRVFYFRPGHESFPTYYDKNVRKVISNAVQWAAPTPGVEITWDNVQPLEKLD